MSGFRTGYRSCFDQEVERDPEARGALAVSIFLLGSGQVARVELKPTGRLSARLVACCRNRLFSVPYPATDDGGPATLSFEVTFELRPPEPSSP